MTYSVVTFGNNGENTCTLKFRVQVFGAGAFRREIGTAAGVGLGSPTSCSDRLNQELQWL
jgi:hypothetical protein